MEEVKEEHKEVVTMRQLLECGVHFGHQTKRWNPWMKKYIFTSRNGIHVIDLQQSIQLIHVACEFVKEVVKNNGTVLFVGTKKQAQDAVKVESVRCDMPFVNQRWLGGTLTNISTIRQSINKLKDFEKLQESGVFETLSKKEQSRKMKAYTKLNHTLEGIKNMIKTPSVMFVVDTQKEQLAIKEARKLNIPIIGIVDTNADPRYIDYPIPANDDAIRAVKLICSVISDAVVRGRESILESDSPQKDSQHGSSENKAPVSEQGFQNKQESDQGKEQSKQEDEPATDDADVKSDKASEKKPAKKASEVTKAKPSATKTSSKKTTSSKVTKTNTKQEKEGSGKEASSKTATKKKVVTKDVKNDDPEKTSSESKKTTKKEKKAG